MLSFIKNQKQLTLWSMATGSSMALPFVAYSLGWLSVIAIIPFVALLARLDHMNKLSNTRKLIYIWLPGLIMMLITASWIGLSNPEFLAPGFAGKSLKAGIILNYLMCALTFSSGFLFFGLLYIATRIRISMKQSVLIVPALWVVSEWARNGIYGLMMIGENSPLSFDWHFSHYGFPTSVTALGYSGRAVGLFGLSFLIVACNVAIYKIIVNRKDTIAYGTLVFICLLSMASFALFGGGASHKAATIGAVQLAADKRYLNKSTAAEAAAQLTLRTTQAGNLDVLVLPEHAGVFGLHSDNEVNNLLLRTLNQNGTLITSNERTAHGQRYNTLSARNQEGQVVYQNDKQMLVPGGESMPYVYEYIYQLLGKRQDVAQLKGSRETSRGSSSATAYENEGITLGSGACSPVFNPEFYRHQVKQGAQLLTNSASLSMFDKAQLYHDQNQQMVRFIAVSNARPMAQSTKGGTSSIVDSAGKRVGYADIDQDQVLVAVVDLKERKTIYTMLGEWVLALSAVGVGGILLWPHRGKVRRKR